MKRVPGDDDEPPKSRRSRAPETPSLPRRGSGAPPRSSKGQDRASVAPTGRTPSVPADRSKRTSALPKINGYEDDDRANATSTNATAMSTMVPANTAPRSSIVTVVTGPGEGTVYRLEQGENLLGRSDDCDVVLLERSISRLHARILLTKSSAVLRENKAKNGTFVNDCTVTGEREIRPGDEIRLGKLTTLLYSQSRHVDDIERRKARSVERMVAGVAHQLNTPLGVANTANALIQSLANELQGTLAGDSVAELIRDLQASAGLVGKSLMRTEELVRSFKQLAAKEFVDDCRECDIGVLVNDCVADSRAASDQGGVTIVTHWPADATFPWIGFPMSLYKVVEHLLQNSRRHAYGSKGGIVDVRLKTLKARYRLEVEDYGVGIAPSVEAHLFEPFVTSDSTGGASGLGLAVAHTIITNLGGMISCNSTPRKGTKFTVIIPFEVQPFDR